jgi:hypothetical protein
VIEISKQRIINVLTSHSKLMTFGIGLAITFGITIATGLINPEQAFVKVGISVGNENG